MFPGENYYFEFSHKLTFYLFCANISLTEKTVAPGISNMFNLLQKCLSLKNSYISLCWKNEINGIFGNMNKNLFLCAQTIKHFNWSWNKVFKTMFLGEHYFEWGNFSINILLALYEYSSHRENNFSYHNQRVQFPSKMMLFWVENSCIIITICRFMR